MVAIIIATDKGEAYCMSKDFSSLNACMRAVANKKKFSYVRETEKRLQYIERAFDMIEGFENERT